MEEKTCTKLRFTKAAEMSQGRRDCHCSPDVGHKAEKEVKLLQALQLSATELWALPFPKGSGFRTNKDKSLSLDVLKMFPKKWVQ